MLPLKLRPKYYIFLLAEPKDINVSSLVAGAGRFKSAPSNLRAVHKPDIQRFPIGSCELIRRRVVMGSSQTL